MKCPNCSADIYANDFCFSCGVDIVLYSKVVNLSNALYNKGLFAANNNDLLGASEALSKSVKINKNNYIARNLLGLVYFEMGQLGDALKQWVISSSLVRDQNSANDYIKDISSSGRTMEKLNDAVSMYNQALIYTKQNSEDMAIIQLKKAIEINPKFVSAYNLLALIYINFKEYDKANQLIEKVLTIDISNKIAISYFKLLNSNKARPHNIEPRNTKVESRPRQTKIAAFEPQKNTASFPFAAIISFIVGAVCCALVLYVLIIPSLIGEKDMQISAVSEEKESMKLQYEDTISTKDDAISLLEQKLNEATSQNEKLLQEQDLQNRLQSLQQAAILAQENSLEEAANLLNSLDTNNFSDESKETYNNLKTDTHTKLAKSFYDAGYYAYNRGRSRYEDAKANFEKCLLYATNESFVSNTIYYLGRIAESNDDIDSAKMYYERIINDFSDSNRYNDARSRLGNLS